MASISDPPLIHEVYKILLDETIVSKSQNNPENVDRSELVVVEECELPVIDLSRLNKGDLERERCKSEIAKASIDWGFFQVVNHGISRELLKRMRYEQQNVFKQPFEWKRKEDKFLNISAGSYRWGTSTATCLKQLSWSEAFHIPLSDISSSTAFPSLRSTIEQFASSVSSLAQTLAEILAEKIHDKLTFFQENCLANTCYLRMNRYPPCPFPSEVYGLISHTDSDFLTILHQDDQVGGLQLVRDGKWIAVKPNTNALIINIGDLFQAWSNGIYKSVQHRVTTNPNVERFSVAYFFCPSDDTVIESFREPSLYRKFSFREYRLQVREDVQKFGSKVGLARFLV